MNVTCLNCKTKINIPDHKIPKDKESVFKCPKCREKVLIPAATRQSGVDEKNTPSVPQSFEGRRNVLVCIDDEELKKKVIPVVRQMGFHVEAVTDTKMAFNKMEYQIYHLVIIDEVFEQITGAMDFIGRVNTFDMSLRRKICLVLISRKISTNDNMAALHASVNRIIHIDDISHLDAFLSNAVTEHKNFYTVYNDSLKLTGKA